MTVGQRILQKRKELGLSQEGLGEQLGVSRQAIYKWESDATLPEIEKLVALSKVFAVSVGWLLGVEESREENAAPAGELTDTQLRMVEEIVGRYQAAQPQPVSKKRRRWPFAVAALALVVVLVSLFHRLTQLDSQFTNLQNSVGNITYQVSSQISGISNRVEEILKSQNNLTADFDTELLSANLAANTVTFQVRATPKTYTPGMTAQFIANDGAELTAAEGILGEGNEFSAQVTCPLTDSITLSVVFSTEGREETQLLEVHGDLYYASFPFVELHISGMLWGSVDSRDPRLEGEYAALQAIDTETKFGTVEIASLRVGLFKDRALVCWYEQQEDQPEQFQGGWEDCTFFRRTQAIVPEDGHEYCLAVFVTDEFGREWVTWDSPVVYDATESFLNFTSPDNLSSDPADWDY